MTMNISNHFTPYQLEYCLKHAGLQGQSYHQYCLESNLHRTTIQHDKQISNICKYAYIYVYVYIYIFLHTTTNILLYTHTSQRIGMQIQFNQFAQASPR